MRIFITGITGFVGSHLADLLVRSGDEVIGTSRDGRWRYGVSEETRRGIPVRPWDIADTAPTEMVDWLIDFQPDAVIHLAGASVPADCGSVEPNAVAISSNVEGTKSVLDLVQRCQIQPHFVHASSCHVYPPSPDRESKVSEMDKVGPANGYGKSKLESERICLESHQHLGLPLTIVRGFQHTGPRQEARMLLPEWTLQAVQGSDCLQVRCLNTQLDLMDVRDTVAIYANLAKLSEGQGVLNVGCGVGTHGRDILNALRDVAGRDLGVQSKHTASRFNPLADVSRLHEVLNLQPQFSLRDTVQATWDFWTDLENQRNDAGQPE